MVAMPAQHHNIADSRFEEIAEKIDKMSEFEEELRLEFARIKIMVEKHEKELYGNGKPGMVTIVDRLEQLGSLLKKIVWLAGATLIGAFLLALFNHLIAK